MNANQWAERLEFAREVEAKDGELAAELVLLANVLPAKERKKLKRLLQRFEEQSYARQRWLFGRNLHSG